MGKQDSAVQQTYDHIEVPLAPALGAEIEGVDLSQPPADGVATVTLEYEKLHDPDQH